MRATECHRSKRKMPRLRPDIRRLWQRKQRQIRSLREICESRELQKYPQLPQQKKTINYTMQHQDNTKLENTQDPWDVQDPWDLQSKTSPPTEFIKIKLNNFRCERCLQEAYCTMLMEVESGFEESYALCRMCEIQVVRCKDCRCLFRPIRKWSEVPRAEKIIEHSPRCYSCQRLYLHGYPPFSTKRQCVE